MIRKTLKNTCIAIALLAPLTAQTPATAKDKPAKWAPQDALIYIGIPDCDKLTESIKKTAMFRMAEDPAIKDIVQPFKKLFENAKSLMAERLGLASPADLEVYPEGGLALYVDALAMVDDPEADAEIALVMEMGDNLEKATRLAQSIVDASLRNGGEKDTREIAGKKITIIRFKKDHDSDADNTEVSASDTDTAEKLLDGVELPDGAQQAISQALSGLEPPEEFAYVFDESRLIVASAAETVASAVKRMNGKGKETLASSKAMRILKRRADKKGQIQFIANIPKMIDLISRSDADAKRNISAMGASSFGPFVATISYTPSSKIDSEMRGFLEISKGERIGLPKILLMENTSTNPPSTVPADAIFYGSINLNPATILEEVIAITSRIDPPAAEQMRAAMKITMLDGTTLDIQKDVIAHLTGPLSMMLSADKPFNNEDFTAYMAIEHDSVDAIKKIFTSIVPPGMLMPSELLGHSVLDVPMMPGLCFAVTDKAMMSATRTAAENYIRGEGKSDRGLKGNRTFKAAAKHVPRKTSAVFYGDGRRAMDAQVAIDKKGDIAPNSQLPFGMPIGMVLRWMVGQGADPDLLKYADAMRKYQTAGIVTLASESDGIRFDAVTILQKEDK